MSDPAKADFAEVDRLLRGAVGDVFPAAQLLVADGGRPVYSASVGACDAGTIFDLASLTKPLVTTTLVMRLIEQGRLALDDELRPGVTVRLALCHAGGLPPWRPLFLLSSTPDPRRAIVEQARIEPLEAPPGTRSAYSDLGFILLGDAVERRGGARLDEQWAALSRSLASSLDSEGTTFHPDPAACAPTEGALRGVVHDENCRAMGGVAGHAGLFGSASAVAAILDELLRCYVAPAGHAPEAVAAARWVQRALLARFWSPSGIPDSTFCLGWDRPSPGASSAGSRWPRSGVGHLGFTGCSIWLDPPRGRYVVLLSNRVYPTRANERIKVFRPLIHDAIVCALDGK